MADIGQNKVYRPGLRTGGHANRSWLMRSRDPRPKAVLIIGDGFTQGLLQSWGIKDSIPCTVNDILPASPDILYYPTGIKDKFGTGLIWDRDKWPNLFKFVESQPARGIDLFAKIAASERINPDLEQGVWSFKTDSVAFELRCYIWHYFRTISRMIDNHQVKKPLKNWRWVHILRFLLSEYRLGIVTFNYEQLIDRILTILLKSLGLSNPSFYSLHHEPKDALDQIPANYLPIIRQHGCISTYQQYSLPAARGANPWLLSDTVSRDQGDMVTIGNNPRLTDFPGIPNLVPPGHQADALCNPHSNPEQLSQQETSSSQLIIICGLSGNEPDTPEVKRLIDSITSGASVVHVGLASDKCKDTCKTYSILNTRSDIDFEFCEASRLDDLMDWLVDRTNCEWDWSGWQSMMTFS